MNAIRFDWKDAMRCATPEQWVSLAILCAAKVYRLSSWQKWAVAWLRGERREAGCDAFSAARAASATEDDLADQARRLFVGGGAARDLNELSRQICAARAAARAAGAAIPVRDDDPSGAARHACQSALDAGLSEAVLSMAVDAVLSGEAPRLLDAMGGEVMPTTECDHCGLCCQKLIIEIDHLDVVREPRLLERAEPMRSCNGRVPDDPWERQYMLACGSATNGCFLHVDGRCAVYPTRPNACVSFVAGSPHCQRLRHEAGLPPLGLDAWPEGEAFDELTLGDG